MISSGTYQQCEAPHRYSGNVTWTPHFGVSRNSSSQVNNCSVIQVSSLLMMQPWHLTYNKMFDPLEAICRWNEPKTFWRLNSCFSLLFFFFFPHSLCVFTHHPPPVPLSLFALLSFLVLNQSMRRSLAQGCSSASDARRRDWPRTVREMWGIEEPCMDK